jgi:hypothetical protein
MTITFKFSEADLNRRLVSLLKKRQISHSVDENGAIHYSPKDEERVENDLISSIRKRIFPAWQVLSCPTEWTEQYRQYMLQHNIPFKEEWNNGQLCFLLPRKNYPHRWKLNKKAAITTT